MVPTTNPSPRDDRPQFRWVVVVVSFPIAFMAAYYLVPLQVPEHVLQMPHDEVYNALARDSEIARYKLARAGIAAALAVFVSYWVARMARPRLK